jgi:hypothetical protein
MECSVPDCQTRPIPIAKVDKEKRLVTAWLNHISDANGKPIVDTDGDIIEFDELENAMIHAFAKGGRGKAERDHETFGLGDVVEHFTLDREHREALGFGRGPAGAIVKVRVTDDRLWKQIKSGEITELSFTGSGERHDA